MSSPTIAESPEERKLRERRWTFWGTIVFWSLVALFLSPPLLLGVMMIARQFESIPRSVAQEHRLPGALPDDFPRPLVWDDTSALSKSFDYCEFRTCKLVKATDFRGIQKWFDERHAGPPDEYQLKNGIEASPDWFRRATASGEIEWRFLMIETERVTPASLLVGFDKKDSRLLLIVSKP